MKAGRIARFISDVRGNFAVIAAVTALPVAMTLGAAIDYSRMSSAEDKLQAAVDAAALAAASSGQPVQIMQQIAKDFVEANFDDYPVEVETTIETWRIKVEASLELPLPVMALANQPVADIAVASTVESPTPLRGGAVAAGESKGPKMASAKSPLQKEIAAARKHYREALRKLPPRQREKLERQFDRYMAELERQAPRQYISR